MRRFLPVLVCCIATAASAAGAPAKFEDCRTLDECLSALDADAHARAHGSTSPRDKTYGTRLEGFGDAAKRALLARMVGDDPDWRNLAGAILMDWKPLGPEDVPALIAALHKDPGGWPARPLGRIATPEAIQALADDVRLHGDGNQSSGALEILGPKALPYLRPILEDSRNWRAGAKIVSELKDDALPALDGWLAIARDPNASREQSDGALRGIAAMGRRAARVGPSLRPLLGGGVLDADHPLMRALLAMDDDYLLPWLVEQCTPSSTRYDLGFQDCLASVAAYDVRARPLANRIFIAFAFSPNAGDRADAASFLGFIVYAPAKARLIELLHDEDWRVVYAAARGLGWMGAKEAMPALHDVAATHWLDAVRQEAAKVEAALASRDGRLARPGISNGSHQSPPQTEDFDIDAMKAPDVAPCKSARWAWQGRSFDAPDKAKLSLDVPAEGALPAGRLQGSDHGEWGGELAWQAAGQAPEPLDTLNIEGIEAGGGGALVVVGGGGAWKSWQQAGDESTQTFTISNGAGGSGTVLLLKRDASGAWREKTIAQLPRAADSFARIAPDLFVAWSGNRAVVLSPDGIKGVAQCVVQ